MPDQLFILVAGAALAGLVQGLSGFAFGLVAMSLWAWFLSPQLAAVLTLTGALAGQILAAFTVRRGFEWRRLAPFLVGGLLGIPLGVALLPRLDANLFKVGLGALLVLWCPAMLLVRELPRIRQGGRAADAVVGGLGGILGGLGGFTGVLPTLWCTLRGLGKDEQRTLVQNFNLGIQLVTLAAYLWQGLIGRHTLPMIATVIPVALLCSWAGTRLYMGLSEARFRQLVLLLLTLSGAVMLASGLARL